MKPVVAEIVEEPIIEVIEEKPKNVIPVIESEMTNRQETEEKKEEEANKENGKPAEEKSSSKKNKKKKDKKAEEAKTTVEIEINEEKSKI